MKTIKPIPQDPLTRDKTVTPSPASRFPFQPPLSPDRVSRLRTIAYDIAANQRSLTRLHDLANGTLDLSQTGCTPAIRRHRRTPADQKRLLDTLAHLYQRNGVLRTEREVILRYGR